MGFSSLSPFKIDVFNWNCLLLASCWACFKFNVLDCYIWVWICSFWLMMINQSSDSSLPWSSNAFLSWLNSITSLSSKNLLLHIHDGQMSAVWGTQMGWLLPTMMQLNSGHCTPFFCVIPVKAGWQGLMSCQCLHKFSAMTSPRFDCSDFLKFFTICCTFSFFLLFLVTLVRISFAELSLYPSCCCLP